MKLKYSLCLVFSLVTFGVLANSQLKLNEASSALIQSNLKSADLLSAKLVDIKAAALDFYVERNRWPTSVELVTDGFYFGNFDSVYGSTISYTVLANSIRLRVDVNDENIAKYISSSISATNNGDVVEYQFGKPSQAAIIQTSLSRVWDGDANRNTMETDLLLGGNSIDGVDVINAAQVNSSTGFFDNGQRVFSPYNLPTKSDVGLGLVANYGISHDYLSSSQTLYASQKAVGDAYNALFNKIESLTKGDVGLSNVPNYGATDSYSGNSPTLFITQRGLYNAYHSLNNTKLDANATAVNANLLDNLDSSAFARSSTTINGHDLTSNVNLTKSDVGLGLVANYGVTGSYTGSSSSLYVNQKALNDAWKDLDYKINNIEVSDADTLDGFDSSDFVKITRKINGKSLSSDITLTKADVGLGNVANYGITDSYAGNRSDLYASQKSVYTAYQALDSSKLDKAAKASDSDRLDGIDSASFVQTSRTINGKNLGSNITITKNDVGLSNVGNYSISHATNGSRTNYYASEKAVGDVRALVSSKGSEAFSKLYVSNYTRHVIYCDPDNLFMTISGSDRINTSTGNFINLSYPKRFQWVTNITVGLVGTATRTVNEETITPQYTSYGNYGSTSNVLIYDNVNGTNDASGYTYQITGRSYNCENSSS
ncbi:MAG: hypothetical protein JKY54_14210 [Flavobacteriales bacterium]|nr:hypothetical protein [Flavobacteriales bacterium]